jgi:hypothetical protein
LIFNCFSLTQHNSSSKTNLYNGFNSEARHIQDDSQELQKARRTGGIEIFAETGMGKPPGIALGPPGFRRDEVAATGKEDDRPGR